MRLALAALLLLLLPAGGAALVLSRLDFLSSLSSSVIALSSLPGADDDAADKEFKRFLDPGIADVASPELADQLLDAAREGNGAAQSCAAGARCAGTVIVPLEFRQGALEVAFGVGGDVRPGFRAIVDTGSPFLGVPSGCSRYWGCYDSRSDEPPLDARRTSRWSGLEDTVEEFVGGEGRVEWRVADVTLLDAQGCVRGLRTQCPPGRAGPWPAAATPGPGITFAVFDEALTNSRISGGGGVFFGLVKYTSAAIRPSLLGQTGVGSFRIRLDTRRRDNPDLSLTLSERPLIPRHLASRAFQLVDLRPYGDTVCHYATVVDSLRINGAAVRLPGPTVAIFDSGTTGCLLSDGLVEAYRQVATPSRPQPNAARPAAAGADVTSDALDDVTDVEVVSPCIGGGAVAMAASRESARSLFMVNAFRGLKAQGVEVVALGLAFMANCDLIVDIDDGRALLTRCA